MCNESHRINLKASIEISHFFLLFVIARGFSLLLIEHGMH